MVVVVVVVVGVVNVGMVMVTGIVTSIERVVVVSSINRSVMVPI